MKRQILAMGGGGFLMEPENPLLDQFLLSLSQKQNPKVCFVSTASGDSQDAIDRFYQNMKNHKCEASNLSLYKAPIGSLRDFVLSKDIIYVGGGNTRNMLALWKEWGLDTILREAYQKGIVLGGVSAGSICWFEQGVTDSITGTLSSLNCLGVLSGSNCPHYDGEVERRPAYHRLILAGMNPGVACDDGVGAYFLNEQLVEFVSSRKSTKGFKVEIQNQKIIETEVAPRYLGSP